MSIFTVFIATLGLLSSSLLFGDEARLNEIERTLLHHQRKASPVLNSTPVNHIIPSFNKITLAFDSEVLNTHLYSTRPGSSESLTLSGYSFTPYVALSLRNIGLGISGEIGHKSSLYETGSSQSGYLEESYLNYAGLGIYFYHVAYQKNNSFSVNIIGGTRLINAKHEARSSSQGGKDGQKYETVKYTVQKADIGINMRFQLNPSFALIPWADYSLVNTNQIDDQLLNSGQPNRPYIHNSRRYAADVELFWHNRRDLVYGVDIALKVQRFELRVGSALNHLTSLNREEEQPDYYKIDDTYTINLGLSYDFKG